MKGLWARHFSTFPDLKGLVALPDRDTPLQFEGHREEFQLRLRLPPNYRVETMLQNVDVQSSKGGIRGSQRIEIGETGLQLTRTFDAKGAIVETDDYPDFRREVLRLEEAIRGSITVKPIDP